MNATRMKSTSGLLLLAVLTSAVAIAAPSKVDGLGDPLRVPGEFIVILDRDKIQEFATHTVLEDIWQVRERTPAVRTAKAAVQAEIMRIAQALSRRYGAKVRKVLGPTIPIILVTCSDQAALALAGDPHVKSVIPNSTLKSTLDTVQTLSTGPNPDMRGLDRIDQPLPPMDRAYHYLLTGQGVHVYVMDTGIRTTHLEFEGRATTDLDVVGGGSGYCTCQVGPSCTQKAKDHGTSVASVIGGKTYGVAKKVRLHSIRVNNCTGAMNSEDVIQGLQWIIENAEFPAVANISSRWLVGATEVLQYQPFVISTCDHLVRFMELGIGLVMGAGNGGWNDDAGNSWPAQSRLGCPTGGLADDILENGWVVGATVPDNDELSEFSSLGSVVNIFAPGEIISVALAADNDQHSDSVGGTSLAAAHVSGVVALHLEGFPYSWPSEVSTEIRRVAMNGLVNNAPPDLGNATNRLLQSKVFANDWDGSGDPPELTLETMRIILFSSALN